MFIRALRETNSLAELAGLMDSVTREMGFRHYALVHHVDHRKSSEPKVNLATYPAAVMDRLLDRGRFRRDPVVRGCASAGGAFLWSELSDIIELDGRDRATLLFGQEAGLNEGITVPFARLGDNMGSCTFAGHANPEDVARFLGPAQILGVFAFRAALKIIGNARPQPASPRLHPRPRDCVVLAGQGFSNKEIARALGLTPRTVDGYITAAKAAFGVHGRTTLVVDAVLSGEVELSELKRRQPE